MRITGLGWAWAHDVGCEGGRLKRGGGGGGWRRASIGEASG